jgi:hypothetical protein
MARSHFHILPMIASIVASVSLFAAASPASANRGAPDYRVTIEKSVTGTKVARDTLWRCNGNECTASAATSRPAIVCAAMAREVGTLSSFTFRGEPIDAEALAKCNSRAR